MIKIAKTNVCDELKKFISLNYNEMKNCCTENLFYLLKYLLEEKEAIFDKNSDFILLASKNGHNEIVELLIRNRN